MTDDEHAANAPNILEGYADRDTLAASFGVAPRTITRWMGQPDGLPHVHLGGRTLFKIDSVRAWLAGREKRIGAKAK